MKIKIFGIILLTLGAMWHLGLSISAEYAGQFDKATYELLWAAVIVFVLKNNIDYLESKPKEKP